MIFSRRIALVCCFAGFCFLAAAAATPASLRAQSNSPTAGAAPTLASQAAPAPNRQAYSLPPDKLAKAIALSRVRNALDIAGGIWSFLFLWLLLATGAWAALEDWARRRTASRWRQGALFFLAFIFLTALANLPLDIIGHHYSRAYALSVESWPSWLGDQAKALGIALLIGTPVLMLFHWIVRRWPRRYWVGIWLLTVPLMVISVFLAPLVIDPLFNRFEPLELHHAPLVAQLEEVVARTGIRIPPNRMYLMKASAKSNGINAYVTGIGASKRYVMWDTAVDRLPNDEILFIFGHESGHYVLHHIPKMIAGFAIGLFFVYWGCAAIAAWLVRRYGPGWRVTDLGSRAGFVSLIFVISVAGFLLEPVGNGFSRHFEHQADIYGQEAIHGIVPDPQKTAVSAFNHLGQAWLEDPHPNPFIKFWLYNHPSVEDRANFAAHYNPWAHGGHGEFFAK